MPKRDDISSVLVIGSGPIVIGQAAEFDYSGTQACRVLREEGIRVVLVNSNPATIMTDPGVADATYVEPITPEIVESIIERERPDAVLATLGGQTALNTAIALHESGALERLGAPLIGANVEAIQLGEDRQAFKGVVERCGAESALSAICHTMEEVLAAARTSSIVWQMADRADSAPQRSTTPLKACRSSPSWIASTLAPMSGAPSRSSAPDSCSAIAVLRAVCPPRVASTASGRSRSMIDSTISGVIGST